MRQAYIGDDGRIYDADGRPADGPAKPPVRRKRPMIQNRRRVRGGFMHGLGQASMSVMPSIPVSPQGVAYRQAARVAVPLHGYTFTRQEGDPKNQVFPGMFVVSDRYPNNLFRVAFRPPTNNDPSITRLAILEGQGAGDYIEVLIEPDGTATPSLMGEFKIVPIDAYVMVEYSLQSYPEPMIPGGAWKADFYSIYTAIDLASFNIATLSEAGTPVTFSEKWADMFSQTATALSFIVDAVDSLGWSFDFGRIGQKELKILTKISSDIFGKVTAIYDMLNPSTDGTLYKTSDGDRIEILQKKVDDAYFLRTYWSVMLSRALLYNQQGELLRTWMASVMFNKGLDMGAEAIASLTSLRMDVIDSVSTQLSPEEASTQVDALLSEYQGLYAGLKQNSAAFNQLWASSSLKDYAPEGMYTYAQFYTMMLKENADLCLQVRDDVRELLTASHDFSGDEGLGAFTVPAGYASVIAMVGPGMDFRRKTAEIIKNDFIGRQLDLEKGLSRDEAVAKGRAQIIGLRQQIEALRGSLSNVDTAVTVRSIQQPAKELGRSVAKLDAEGKQEARQAFRQIPASPEGAIRQGLDQVVNRLIDAERLLEGKVYEADGKTIKPVEKWTVEDRQSLVGQRDKAADLLGSALTQGLVEIKKEADGTEVIVDLIAHGVTSAGGDKNKVGFEIVSSTVDSVIQSNLFSPNAVAGIGRIVAMDAGVSVETLSNKYHHLSGELQEKIENLKYEKTVKDPRTGQEVTRIVSIDPEIKSRLEKDQAYYERLANIFSSAGTAEELVYDYKGKVLSYQDVIDATPDKMVPATFNVLADAKGVQDMAVSVTEQAKLLLEQISGATAVPEFQAVLKSDANSKLTAALQNAVADLNGKLGSLKDYTGAKGQTLLNTGTLPLKDVNDAMGSVVTSLEKVRNAEKNVLEAIKEMNAARFLVKMKGIFASLYAKTAPSEVVEFGKKSSFGSVIALILVGPLRLGIVWALAQAAFLPFGIHIGNPIVWVSRIIEGLIGLLPSPRVGDVVPSKQEATRTGETGYGTSLLFTAFAISMVFFGKQLFPVIGELIRTVGSGLKTVNQLIPWAKKKGKRGRPSEGGESGEKKLRGRGAPIEVDQAIIDLDEARAGGDVQAEERLIKKLKRAAERGQSVPPGLWGYYRR